ncbi:MAG: hypothetical protein Q9165_008636 [Trypethelium subeluteriae]
MEDVKRVTDNLPNPAKSSRMDDGRKEISSVAQLLNVLSHVLGQHVDFFAKFIKWVRNTDEQTNDMVSVIEKIETDIKQVQSHQRLLTTRWPLPEKDTVFFASLKGKWICLTPQEITILFIRLYFDSEQCKNQGAGKGRSEHDYGGMEERDGKEKDEKKKEEGRGDGKKCTTLETTKSTLKDFLDFLLREPWATRLSCKEKSEIPPLVPKVVCFDETHKRLGISQPNPPESQGWE